MAEAAKPARAAGGEPAKTKARREPKAPKASGAAGGRAPVLDPTVAAVMTLSANLQRACTRQMKTLWRKKGMSERGLFILELVHAGLDRPSRLIEYFDVLPSTITFETEKLVTAGLMLRESEPSDRRVVRLSLTSQGRAVHREATAALNALLRPRLEQLPPDELRAFLETFEKIVPPIPRQTDEAEQAAEPNPITP